MEGRKDDQGKLRFDLIPPGALTKLAEVYTTGARKYGDHNWRQGMAWSRIVAALYRHLTAWQQGRVVDPDDGQHPLASVAWCAFTLMEYERLGVGPDDRPFEPEFTPEEKEELEQRILSATPLGDPPGGE